MQLAKPLQANGAEPYGEATALDREATVALGRKVLLRLALPTCGFMLLSSLDRVNVSFAAVQMNHELGFTPSQYGFEPASCLRDFWRVSIRACCCCSGSACIAGCRSARSRGRAWPPALACISQPWEFYLLRVLLGIAEGGLAPGIVVYLSQFISNRRRATTFALPMLAIPLSIVIGGPLSGWLMSRPPLFGLAPWRFMILAESVPVIVLALAAARYFPDRPQQARWLSAAEQRWLSAEAGAAGGAAPINDWRILRNPLIWACALLWFCLLSGAYGIMFWLPQMIARLTGLSPLQIGLVNSLPWLGAMAGTYFNSRHSDATGERLWHVALPAVLASAALLAAWHLGPSVVGVSALSLAGLGLGAAQGAFWAIPTRYLTPATFAVASVAINICGSSGGILMPHSIGYLIEHTGGLAAPTFLMSGMLALAALLVLFIGAFYFRRADPPC